MTQIVDVPGHGLVEFPDGMSNDQIVAAIKKNSMGSKPDYIDSGAMNFAQDLPWTTKFAAGYGKAGSDLYQGAKQLLGFGNQSQIDEQKRLDAPLMKTGGGVVGNIAGNMAIGAPLAFAPGANTLIGAGIYGAAQSGLQPVETGGPSRGQNMALGGAAGVGGLAAGRLIGRAVRPFANSLNPEVQQIANTASSEGIPLTLGQKTGSRPLQIAESVMENLPFTSGPQLAVREAQQKAFTSAALKRAGISSDVANAGALLSQKQNLGGQLGRIANNSSLDFNQGLATQLANIVGDATQHLPPNQAASVSSVADQILSQVDQSGAMAGTNYQGWREPLRGMAKEGGALGRYFGQIRGALDSEFASQAGPAYKEPARQYANLKTIIDAMGGPGALPAQGQIPAAGLSSSLARSIGKESKTLGGGDLNALAKVGQQFVRDQIPNSGTAQRQAIQNLLMGNIGGTITGGALGGATGLLGDDKHFSSGGALLGAGTGAALSLGGPRAVQMILQSPALQTYLMNGLLPISEFQRQALIQAVRSASVGSIPALRASVAPQP